MTSLPVWLPVRLKKLNPAAEVPEYRTPGAAACDLCALPDGPVTLGPGERALIPTGIALDFGEDSGVVCLIFARSGLASKHGVCLANGVGVVDADYRGEIRVALCNRGSEPYTVRPGDRVAQMAFVPVLRAAFEEVPDLGDTERGEGGFGHTGV